MSGFLVCASECDQCLFGPNRVVSSSRMKQLLADTRRRDTFFVCHKATLNGHTVACAGWHARFDCNLSRIAGRLGAVSFVDPETASAPDGSSSGALSGGGSSSGEAGTAT